MDCKRALELLRIEQECVNRNALKACDRDCGKCDLAQEDTEVFEAFEEAIIAMEEKIGKEEMSVWEDTYQVFRKIGKSKTLLASDMSLENVVIFIEAWFSRHFNDQESSLIVSRQPMDRDST